MVEFSRPSDGLGITKIKPRDPNNDNRTSTELELFFDLVYVIAVSAAASGFYHRLENFQIWFGLREFFLAFLILWNGWSAFTWFASGYDPDDLPYRIAVLGQLFGSLMIAANLNTFFEQGITWVGVTGFTVMRIALISQWFRVYRQLKPRNRVAKRHLIGFSTLQLFWILWLFAPDSIRTSMVWILMFGEILMPMWAHAGRFYSWNPSHIAERYGLLAIIVLGEGVASANVMMQPLLTNADTNIRAVLIVASSTTALSFSLWWLYFNVPFSDMLRENRNRPHLLIFNVAHILLFMSLAALGSALKLIANLLKNPDLHTSTMDTYIALILITILALFLSCIATMRHFLAQASRGSFVALAFALLILLCSYIAVKMGVSLGLTIWPMVMAPMLMTVYYSIDGKRWRDPKP